MSTVTEQAPAKWKTYTLLPSMDVNAPVFVRISKDQRVRIDKLPKWSPFLKVTFQDTDGRNKTIRYKETANSIYQDIQIKEEGIPANEPFTTNERRAPEFRNGVLVTNKVFLQNYLDNYPANEVFYPEGKPAKINCPDVTFPTYKEYKKSDELKTNNEDFRLRTKAANKIAELELTAAQEMIARLLGVAFEVPKAIDGKTETEALDECIDILVSYLDGAELDGLNAILQDTETSQDKVVIMVNKLLSAGVVSFDEVAGQVSQMVNKKWVKVTDMPDGLEQSEKQRLFVDFLNSEAGAVQLSDLEKKVKKIDNP